MLDDAHTHSARANAFIEKRSIKIATCPLVENGVIRVLNLPGYGMRGAIGIDQIRTQLKRATTLLDHEFWPDDVSVLDDIRLHFSKVFGDNQITDVYLLTLAVAHRGALVTFDQHITLTAVKGATDKHLVVLR